MALNSGELESCSSKGLEFLIGLKNESFASVDLLASLAMNMFHENKGWIIYVC